LVAEQTQAESQVITRNSILLNAIIGGISLIIAVVAGLVVSRQMTLPLVRLGKTAEQIAAGDFNLRVPGEGTDEIGSLALALDKMTRQLRSLISGLEERVAERTAEVERRSSQLQVASMVARDATSIHDLDSLMNRAVEMIVERFDFYHAGIFLVDELGEYAVLRAAPGDAGRRMLDVGHKLRVGEEGIVGHVSSTGQARIALDVGEDAVHFRNPMLPQTRSEMGLPLRVAERVIGVLDVQSTHGAAFDQEDVDILQTMADQLSVAIENARLFNSMSDALSQLQIAQQEYTQESWKRFTQDPQRTRGYRYRGIGVETYDHELPTVEGEHILQVPLKIREQLVGNIRLKLNNPAMESEIISTVEEISSRLSIVLESARLLEETQLRSEQIRLLQEVTSAASMNIEMNALLNEVIQKIAGGFNFDHCSILMFDPDLVNGTLIASKNAQGEDTHVVGMRVPVSSSPLMVDLVNHQKSLAVYNAVNDPKAYSIKEILSQFDANTLILTPIIVRSEIQGVILLTSTDITRRMSDEDLRLLDQIGLQVAVGVDVAQLFELTEKRAQREQVINEIANRMRESLEIDIVLQTAAREMRKALNLDDVTIQLAVSNENRSN
jgi:GAF domain-containing protein